MKKILSFIVLLITVAACTVDDDEPVYYGPEYILGSWKEMLITSPPASESQNVSDCAVTQVSLLYSFYENGNFMILNACDPALAEPRSGTYTLSDNVLILTEGETVITYHFTYFTSTIMELQRFDENNEFITHLINLEKQN